MMRTKRKHLKIESHDLQAGKGEGGRGKGVIRNHRENLGVAGQRDEQHIEYFLKCLYCIGVSMTMTLM